MERETKEIRLESLLPFKIASEQTYVGEQFEQLMGSIEKEGLMNPVVVRPAADGKYEIICGHNWVRLMESLGSEVIHAEVRDGLSDEEAIELFLDRSLNQRFFHDLDYSQKFKAIKHFDKVIRANSRQGKRTDLERKTVEDGRTSAQIRQKSIEDNGTYVQIRQKSAKKSNRDTTRDKVARSLGMSSSDFGMYRRIIKLPDKLLEPITNLLDEEKITFGAAYIMSGMRDVDVEYLLDGIDKHPDREIDMEKLKQLPRKRDVERDRRNGILHAISPEMVLEVLVPKDSSPILNVVRRE